MRPTRRFLLLLASLSLLLPRCGPGPEPAEDGKVVLRLTTWAGSEEMEIMDRCIELFEAAHPQVDVRHEPIPTNYKEKMMISMAGGAPPDVMLVDSDDLPAFVGRGLLMNLAPYAGRVDLDLSLFYPNVLEIGRSGDALYAFPKDFTPMVIYYNTDLLEAEGVSPEGVNWTWDEFLAAARATTVDADSDGEPEVYGAYVGRYFYYWQPWIWSGGGAAMSPDGTAGTGYIDSPASRDVIRFLADLRLLYRLSPRPEVFRGTSGMVQNLFYVGRLAMIESGHWAVPSMSRHISEGRIRIGVANIPHREGVEPVTVMYESGWAVPVAGRHRKWAVRLAAFMADEESQRIRGRLGLAIPAMPHIAREIVEEDPWGVGDAFLEIALTARPSRGTQVDNYRTAARQLEEVFDLIYARGESVVEATAAVAPKVDEVLGSGSGAGGRGGG